MISILIVNWNGKRYLRDCLRSIASIVSGAYEVILMDNASTDGSATAAATEFPWLKLVTGMENTGFGRGNNLAAGHAAGDVLLLLNYDTILLADPSGFAQALREDHEIGCIGSAMCNAEGMIVPNCGHFPSPLRLLLFSSQFWKPYREAYGPAALVMHRVDWVEGSWLLIRRDTWDRIGGFDPQIFLYGEDVDLSRRIANLGLLVLHASAVAYRHYVGWSIERLPYQYAGYRLFHQKHSGSFVRASANTILLLGLWLRLSVYATLALTTRKRSFQLKTEALRQVRRQWKQLGAPGIGRSGDGA